MRQLVLMLNRPTLFFLTHSWHCRRVLEVYGKAHELQHESSNAVQAVRTAVLPGVPHYSHSHSSTTRGAPVVLVRTVKTGVHRCACVGKEGSTRNIREHQAFVYQRRDGCSFRLCHVCIWHGVPLRATRVISNSLVSLLGKDFRKVIRQSNVVGIRTSRVCAPSTQKTTAPSKLAHAASSGS